MLTQLSSIVTEVGQLLLEWRERGMFDGAWEAPHKFKAVVDGMAHEALCERLNSLSPRLIIISEEDKHSWVNRRPRQYWMIDPLDGTSSYVQGYNGFVTQVALMVDNRPYISAVYAPIYKQLYTGEIGNGAYLNGSKLIVAKTPVTTLIDNFPEPRGSVLSMYNTMKLTHYVECGGIALKMCRIADGTADVFFKEVVIHNWDTAAPQLILEEAGGIVTDGHGIPITYRGEYWITGLVATNTVETHHQWFKWHKHYIGGE